MQRGILTSICFFCVIASTYAQMPTHDIMFVTAVPNCADSATQYSVIGNQLGSFTAAIRGGDLWIRYADGSLRNLTAAAGLGTSGKPEDAIAVRQPSIHWEAERALFSMLVGTPTTEAESEKFVWQIYEIRGFGQNEIPIITKIPGQPLANNICPIYGTDDKIIFSSDRARLGSELGYHYIDESLGMRVNSGLWSLDPVGGNLLQLDHAPSGDYDASIDSYGRVIFSRWDILQHDQLEAITAGAIKPLTYSNESVGAQISVARIEPPFPEHNPRLDVALNSGSGQNSSFGYFNPSPPAPLVVDQHTGTEGTLFDPRLPSDFFPWAMNEDGSEVQTVNHIGRHDLRDTIPAAITTDPSIRAFSSRTKSRANSHELSNALQLREDPLQPGSFYAIDALPARTHGAGQIVRIDNLKPTDASRDVSVEYITPRQTRQLTAASSQVPPMHSGLYRNPLPTSDGLLIASHTYNTFADAQTSDLNLDSKFKFRLRLLKSSGGFMVPGSVLTPGIRKWISYYNSLASGSPLMKKECELWEMDPVEVVQRTRPQKRVAEVASEERQVFEEEQVSLDTFHLYLKKNNLAVVVSRDLTHRDNDDQQQPYYLNVAGTKPKSDNTGKVTYAISDVEFVQADYLRGHGTIPKPATNGRRVLAVSMHDACNRRFDTDSTKRYKTSNLAHIAEDGSMASFVPATRGVCWQLISQSASPVVRERYWLSFAPGEIRTCAQCHGENNEAKVFSMPPPTNKPFALRGLLRSWKQDNIPSTIALQAPQNLSLNVLVPLTFTWKPDSLAQSYTLTLRVRSGNRQRVVLTATVPAPQYYYTLSSLNVSESENDFSWEVRGNGPWGSSASALPFRFSTSTSLTLGVDEESNLLALHPNPARDLVHCEFARQGASHVQVELYNVVGDLVYTNELRSDAEIVKHDIPVDALTPGMYMLRVTAGEVVLRRRLVVAQ